MKIVKRLALAALFFILVASISGAQGIPQATSPEEVGLSKERLQKISAWIQTDVNKKVVPGAVAMVLSDLRPSDRLAEHQFGPQDSDPPLREIT